MNEKFFSLPIEKQEAIINAGYRVFSENSYKKSPMSEIADAAGISKSLLFYYFHNKKEKDPEVRADIQKSIAKYADFKQNVKQLNFDSSQFVPGIDIEMMYNDMYWASEGYIWEKIQDEKYDVDMMERDFLKMVDFWKSIYLRKEGEHDEGN